MGVGVDNWMGRDGAIDLDEGGEGGVKEANKKEGAAGIFIFWSTGPRRGRWHTWAIWCGRKDASRAGGDNSSPRNRPFRE